MNDTLAAYWGPRSESPGDAAKRIRRVCDALSAHGPWFETGSARPKPEDATDLASLGNLLERGVNRRDTDNSVIEELGYSLDLWNGDLDASVKLTCHIGSTSSVPGTTNNVVVKLPEGFRSRATAIFATLIDATDPDRAIWMTREYRRSQPTINGLPYVGWQTYLTEPYSGRAVPPPEGVAAQRRGNGVWLTTGPEPGQLSQTLAAKVATTLQ